MERRDSVPQRCLMFLTRQRMKVTESWCSRAVPQGGRRCARDAARAGDEHAWGACDPGTDLRYGSDMAEAIFGVLSLGSKVPRNQPYESSQCTTHETRIMLQVAERKCCT